MTTFTALFDACVLYPAPVRDLLLELSLRGLFRARWSDKIHDEWMGNLLQSRPDLTRDQLLRTRALIDQSNLDGLVTGHEHLIDALQLPDANDRHIPAAAIRSGAGIIVTYNLRDFPPEYLAPFGIETQHPDEFMAHLVDLAPGQACLAVRRVRARLRKPPMSVDDYLDTLRRPAGTMATASSAAALAPRPGSS